MTSFSSLRFRLVGTVFLAVAPASVLMYSWTGSYAAHFGTQLTWTEFVVGLMALAAAWFGGERFILRQVLVLSQAARRLGAGDLTSRTGLSQERGELGELAHTFDAMAASLEERVNERERTERVLLNRAFQQTVVAALGQFAMISDDVAGLLNQAVMLVAQTLEVEFCHVLELQPDSKFLRLRAGVGWKDGYVGKVLIPADSQTEPGFTLTAGDAVAFDNLPAETRFRGSSLLADHGVVSGVTVAIAGHGQAFGVLGAHTARKRSFTEDEIHFLFSLATVLAMAVERIRSEAELQKVASFAQLNPNPALELNADGAVTYFNEAALKLARAVGQDNPRPILPPNSDQIVRHCLKTCENKLNLRTVYQGRTLSWAFHPVSASQVVHCYVQDITEQLSLEAQLRQAQKMESVGQLAAGVAHDFNNMLTIIQGHSGHDAGQAGLAPELLDSTQAIYFASERAASLTRQLLMFSRKNVMQPKPLDLRDVVAQLCKMLKRLLGETITLEFHPPRRAPLVAGRYRHDRTGHHEPRRQCPRRHAQGRHADHQHATRRIDEAYAQTHPEARPGHFVCLRVSDTGCGMDATTKRASSSRSSQPRKSAKAPAWAWQRCMASSNSTRAGLRSPAKSARAPPLKFSSPPAARRSKRRMPESPVAAAVQGGPETILVVEDELVLREMAHLILQECGYRVLEAASGAEALQVWEQHPNSIDLVLTDVVMPGGMSGRELSVKLKARHPQLKIVFTSGYNVDDSNTDFFHRGGATFLQKPYTRIALAKAVRTALDQKGPQPEIGKPHDSNTVSVKT